MLLLFTNYRLSNITLRFILPEDRAAENASPSRVTIRAALDAYLESLRIKKRPTKTITCKTYELGLFTGFCKKSYIDELVSADLLGFRDYCAVRRLCRAHGLQLLDDRDDLSEEKRGLQKIRSKAPNGSWTSCLRSSTRCTDLQKKLFVGGRLELLRDLLCGNR